MYSRASLLLLLFIGALRLSLVAQTIKGEVVDKDNKHAINGVTIENVYTALAVNTSDDGSFVIAASQDQLLEFRKTGYKTVKVRIPKGYSPNYYKIIMEHGFTKVEDMIANNNRYDYVRDSIRYHELYKHEIDFPKLSGIDAIAHPFSAMSSRNREIWKFQKDYDNFEQEKYVDRTFNEAVVTKFTGLTGDSLHYYIRRYRPTYEELRAMNDYTFFTYIKKTVTNYRNASSHSRGAQ